MESWEDCGDLGPRSGVVFWLVWLVWLVCRELLFVVRTSTA